MSSRLADGGRSSSRRLGKIFKQSGADDGGESRHKYHVEVRVVSAEGLRQAAWMGKSQLVAVAWVNPWEARQTHIAREGGTDPVWNECLLIPLHQDQFLASSSWSLKVRIFHLHTLLCGRPLRHSVGTATVPAARILHAHGAAAAHDDNNATRFIMRYPLLGFLGQPHGMLNLIVRLQNYDNIVSGHSGVHGLGRRSSQQPLPPLLSDINDKTRNDAAAPDRSTTKPTSTAAAAAAASTSNHNPNGKAPATTLLPTGSASNLLDQEAPPSSSLVRAGDALLTAGVPRTWPKPPPEIAPLPPSTTLRPFPSTARVSGDCADGQDDVKLHPAAATPPDQNGLASKRPPQPIGAAWAKGGPIYPTRPDPLLTPMDVDANGIRVQGTSNIPNNSGVIPVPSGPRSSTLVQPALWKPPSLLRGTDAVKEQGEKEEAATIDGSQLPNPAAPAQHTVPIEPRSPSIPDIMPMRPILADIQTPGRLLMPFDPRGTLSGPSVPTSTTSNNDPSTRAGGILTAPRRCTNEDYLNNQPHASLIPHVRDYQYIDNYLHHLYPHGLSIDNLYSPHHEAYAQDIQKRMQHSL